ncbi:MAG: tRNA (N6-threonylcarbamoyladenosine(37)-N6)-methyltransferase TrmO [Guyparkeria sp.]|uniref:tRNA (N6-threonylcarbamoyladenosine(37)-N6)-methyltransferase TrmO n=1 Tax=Guyparkeria sp. TaxID=2035736 RepID=UPI00397BAA62
MSEEWTLRPVGHIESPYREGFGIPRQSGVVPAATGLLVPTPEWQQPVAWQGIETFSHLWLVWVFHAKRRMRPGDSSAVRPPRLGGNRRVGVFASRAPVRPNPIGLSVVRLLDVTESDGRVRLHLGGLDLLDGTPVLDVKPHVPYADCPPDSRGGWASAPPERLAVVWGAAEPWLERLDSDTVALIEQSLAQDPRPAFHDDPDRVYGMRIEDIDVRFVVQEHRAEIREIVPVGD